MNMSEQNPSQVLAAEIVRGLTSEAQLLLADLLIEPPTKVTTVLANFPDLTREKLQELGITAADPSTIPPSVGMTDFGWKVAFAAATRPRRS